MKKSVYVFKTNCSKIEIQEKIENTIVELGGKFDSKRDVGKWKDERYPALLKAKAEFFYAEKENVCNVRAVINGEESNTCSLWHTFLRKFFALYPSMNIGINADEPRYLLAVLDLTGDTQQVITANTTGGTSLGGFLLGGLAFGATGAIVGGLSGTQRTKGVTQTTFSKRVWVRVLWSDGGITEENPSKNSRLYQQIMTLLA